MQGLRSAASVSLSAAASGSKLTASATIAVQPAGACLTHISLVLVGGGSWAGTSAAAQQLLASLSVQQVQL